LLFSFLFDFKTVAYNDVQQAVRFKDVAKFLNHQIKCLAITNKWVDGKILFVAALKDG